MWALVRVTARYLNHPGLALGYRLEAGGATVVYASDHEPHSRHQPSAGAGAPPARVHPEDQRHVEFLAGADLVIHDAQYTLEEYPQKLTWGHSPAELAVDFALAAGVKRLALFHHDPMRSDDAVDRLVEACRRRVAASGASLDVFAAAESQVIEIIEPDVVAAAGAGPASPLATRESSDSRREASVAKTVLMVDDDPDIIRLLTIALQPAGFRLLSASDGDTALQIARAQRPDLLLLDWDMPGRDGLEVCRALRADPDPQLAPGARGTADRPQGGRGYRRRVRGRSHRLRHQAVQAHARPLPGARVAPAQPPCRRVVRGLRRSCHRPAGHRPARQHRGERGDCAGRDREENLL